MPLPAIFPSPIDIGLIGLGVVLLVMISTWLFPLLQSPIIYLLSRLLYRLSIHETQRLPQTGGCLILCNHVSFVDWLLLSAASSRKLTFVLWEGYYRNPLLAFFLSCVRGRTIRLPDRLDHPHEMASSLARIAEALDRGEAVLMFPEGTLTRSGHLLRFGRGFERILSLTTTDVPIVPACTYGLWGGIFSYHAGRVFWKRPQAFRPHVGVMFGIPLSRFASSTRLAIPWSTEAQKESEASEVKLARKILRAPEVKLIVQELIADCAIRQSIFIPLVHRSFIRNSVKLRSFFRTCIIDTAAGERVLSWGKVFVAALCVTKFLRGRFGNDRAVGIWLPTSLAGALANLAIAFLGKISVNLNYTAGAGSVQSAVRQAGVRQVVTSKRFLARFPLDLPPEIERIYLEDALASITRGQKIRTFLTGLLLPGWFIDRFLLGLHRHKHDDLVTIVFSSGSTGEPKGVMLTHANIATNVDAAILTIGISRSDQLLGVLPFFHSFGYTVCLWAPFVADASVVLHPDPRGAKEVGNLVRKHKTTLVISTATFLRFYLRRCGVDDFRSVRILICGAEKLPVKLQQEFAGKFGILPLEGYGCTELSPVVSANLPPITAGGLTQIRNIPGTVGQPVVGVCVRAFTQESREPLAVGREGVLCARGPNVMVGYLGEPLKTSEVIRMGWYYTGDVGVVRPDGYIQITGRISRFAKIAGEMVPLERLEEEMHEALDSAGERLLAVAAIPDEKRGERLIVLHTSEVQTKIATLFEKLSVRGVPNLWIPDSRDCFPVEAMPVLGSGKLDLKQLGELARAHSNNIIKQIDPI